MASFLVKLSGDPAGGTASLEVVLRSRTTRVETATRSGEPLRRVSERLVVGLEETMGTAKLSADYADGLIVLSGIEDVYPATTDRGLSAREMPLDRPLRVSSMTFGLRSLVATTTPSVDDTVLYDLGRLVAGLARAGAAEQKLLDSALAAQKTFVQATRAYLTGTELPPASPGGPIASSPAATEALLGALGAHAPELMRNLAALSDARGRGLDAVRAKEQETKKNRPTTTGGGGGTTGGKPGPPPGTQSGPGGTPSTLDPGAPGNPPPPGTTWVRNLDGGDETQRLMTEACRIRIFYIDGMRVVIGNIAGRWYTARGEFTAGVDENGDGEDDLVVPGTFDFGSDDDGDPGDPDLEAKLEAIVAERQAAQHQAADPWRDEREMASFALSLIPIVGDVKALTDAATGWDVVEGRALSFEERLLNVMSVALPFIGKALGKAARSLIKGARAEISAGRRGLSALEREGLRDAAERLSRARSATGLRPSRTLGNHCQIRRTYVARQGRRLPTVKCVPAGTLVHLPGGQSIPIETVPCGAFVLASGTDGKPIAREVLAAGRSGTAVPLTLELTLPTGVAELALTAEHEVATPIGFRQAGELKPGAEILCLDGRRARVASILQSERPMPVYNLDIATDHSYFAGDAAVLVHNGIVCPTPSSTGAAAKALEEEGVRKLSRAKPEGAVGSYGELKNEARDVTRERAEAWRAAGNTTLQPASRVVTPNHIPSRGLMAELGVETERVGAITMSMEEHMLTATYDKGVRPIKPYLDALKAGVPPAQVFQQALKDDLKDMLKINGQKFTGPCQELIGYYEKNFPDLMKGMTWP